MGSGLSLGPASKVTMLCGDNCPYCEDWGAASCWDPSAVLCVGPKQLENEQVGVSVQP